METNETLKPVKVELPPHEPCKACGVKGPHYCTGGQKQHGGWVGVRHRSERRSYYPDNTFSGVR